MSGDQLADMQRDLGFSDDEAVFKDAELDRLYTRAESNYELAVALGVRQLLMDAAKFNDYTAGASTERKSQVFEHLKEIHTMWASAAGVGTADGGVLAALSAGTIIQDFQEPDSTSGEYA